MTTNRDLSNLALAMMALPIMVGAPLCYLRPDRVWLWVLAMLFLPVSWLGIKATFKAAGNTMFGVTNLRSANPVDARKAISPAMVFASLIVTISLGAKLAEVLGLIDPPLAHAIATRWTNVLAGGYFVFRGNHLPKVLTPLSDTRCDPARMQTLQRRTGWAYVLAGFTFAVAWLVLPVRLAQPLGIAIIVAGILVPTLIMRRYSSRRTGLLSL